MGFVEKVKNVISRLRAAGKTEKEVSEIIEQAAETATILKKTESPEHPEKIKAAGGENLQDALLKVGISAKEALTAFESIYRLRRQEKSNNWRKYHGSPLKRSKRRKTTWRQKKK
nr:MAG TPA: hypothetical protein [Caudoviricetes sp.]